MAETLLKPLKAGLIGADIQASLTPAMHMQEGAAQGLDYAYELIDLTRLNASPADLSRLIEDAEARGLAGLNITHPCKQLVIPLLDDLSPEARALGAVNTVVLKGGRRFGHNTDWVGFCRKFSARAAAGRPFRCRATRCRRSGCPDRLCDPDTRP